MATRKKAKGKAKRKKTGVIKAAKRKKATTVRKTKTIRKKPTKKAPLPRVSPEKARPSAKAAIRPTPVSPPAQPEAVRPTPSAQPLPAEQGERIGVVNHYYSHVAVAIIRLESGTLRVGDEMHIRGHTTDFIQKVESLVPKNIRPYQ